MEKPKSDLVLNLITSYLKKAHLMALMNAGLEQALEQYNGMTLQTFKANLKTT